MRVLLLLIAACAFAAEDGFVPLFNGRSLDGWDGDMDRWSVQDGAIVGSSDGKPFTVNTFLVYKQREFANFILKADIRLRNHNSGIQFRSTLMDGPGWKVMGYQADASEAGERSAWGNFYEERGRGRATMKTPGEGWDKAKGVFKKQDWNSYEILADGDHIKLTFNGLVTIDTHDDKAKSGILALQLHAGEQMRVEFRNIRIKVLP